MYGILIYDDVEPIDIGASYGVLSIARRLAPNLEFRGVARQAGPVACANGLQVIADFGFDDAPEFSDLIVTGGPGWVQAAEDGETLNYLRHSNARMTAICTGAMILAAAGVLTGRQATTKHRVFKGETPPVDLLPDDVHARQAVVVEDGGVTTGGGITLGIDTIFHALARSHGQDIADEAARVMEYDRALAANAAALGRIVPA